MLTERMVVYLAKNKVNGNCYVGSTKHALGTRKKDHFRMATRGVAGCPIFYKAIRKYGESAFEWVILDRASSVEELRDLETKRIAELRPKYNVATKGWGGNGGKISEAGLRSISEFQKGKKWRLGTTHSAETRDRLRAWGLENSEHWEKYRHLGPTASSKKVVCLNTDKIYESASAAAKANGISKSLVIEVCLRNSRRKTAGGLVFRYFGDHLGGEEEAHRMLSERDAGRRKHGKSCAKSIVCTTYNIRFSSARAASQEYCIPRQSINEVCNGNKTSVYGLKFSYIGNAAL